MSKKNVPIRHFPKKKQQPQQRQPQQEPPLMMPFQGSGGGSKDVAGRTSALPPTTSTTNTTTASSSVGLSSLAGQQEPKTSNSPDEKQGNCCSVCKTEGTFSLFLFIFHLFFHVVDAMGQVVDDDLGYVPKDIHVRFCKVHRNLTGYSTSLVFSIFADASLVLVALICFV
jgi:hypothetical protein